MSGFYCSDGVDVLPDGLDVPEWIVPFFLTEGGNSGAVLEPLVRAVFNGRHDLSLRCTIGSQFIGDDALGRHALLCRQTHQQLLGSLGIAPGLRDLVEDLTVLINGAPQIMFLARNVDHHFIKMPDIAVQCLLAVQPASIVWSGLDPSATDDFVRYEYPMLQKHFLDQS